MRRMFVLVSILLALPLVANADPDEDAVEMKTRDTRLTQMWESDSFPLVPKQQVQVAGSISDDKQPEGCQSYAQFKVELQAYGTSWMAVDARSYPLDPNASPSATFSTTFTAKKSGTHRVVIFGVLPPLNEAPASKCTFSVDVKTEPQAEPSSEE